MRPLAAEEITMNDEAAVHIDPLKPRNRGQETMPWREIETIANATVFIKGEWVSDSFVYSEVVLQ